MNKFFIKISSNTESWDLPTYDTPVIGAKLDVGDKPVYFITSLKDIIRSRAETKYIWTSDLSPDYWQPFNLLMPTETCILEEQG